MTSKFGNILDMLIYAFKNTVSVHDCAMIVDTLRDYEKTRPDAPCADEQRELSRVGYPLDYHPCEHMDRIRFCMVFGENDNEHIQDMLKKHSELV